MKNWTFVVAALIVLLAFPAGLCAQEAAGDGGLTDGLMDEAITTDEVPDEADAEVVESGKEEMGVATYWGDEELDEIVHGFFITTHFGAQMFLLDGLTKDADPGFMTGLSFGYDILDKYLSLELGALFSYHGAPAVDLQAPPTTSGSVKGMSGDFSMLRVPIAITGRYFPLKRLELHFALTGGLAYSPEAVEAAYNVDPNTGDVLDVEFKDGPVMDYFAGGRLGLEYYMGLRHFSIGLNLEADYIIQHECLGLMVAPYVKYTF